MGGHAARPPARKSPVESPSPFQIPKIIHVSAVVWPMFAIVKSGHQRNINSVTMRTSLKTNLIAFTYAFAEDLVTWLNSFTSGVGAGLAVERRNCRVTIMY